MLTQTPETRMNVATIGPRRVYIKVGSHLRDGPFYRGFERQPALTAFRNSVTGFPCVCVLLRSLTMFELFQ
ncbi:hypothetical protein QCA50_019761 [Cerrena zonata]|uniref:Uncharacterized protein n=1 Tax=Cerrena zonata TaxID=2478898 RepID=A0AAW0FKS4_9APHY